MLMEKFLNSIDKQNETLPIKQEECSNVGDAIDEAGDQDMLGEAIDPNLHLELEQLKLQEIQCKQRMLLLKEATKRPSSQSFSGSGGKERSFLPDGRIVVRNLEKSADPGEGYTGGAGDALTPPALQRVPLRACVTCSRAAEGYCAGCGVTPYCSDACQKRDWEKRHRSVCHNLARLGVASNEKPIEESSLVPAQAPLRQPRPSQSENQPPKNYGNRATAPEAKNANARFMPSGLRPESVPKNQDAARDNNRPHFGNRNGIRDNCNNRNRYTDADNRRQTNKVDDKDDDEDWGPATSQPKIEVTTAPQPKPIVKQATPEPVKTSPVKDVKKLPLIKDVADVTPTRKMVPKNYVLEVLKIGDVALLSVEGKTPKETLCICMHDSVENDYQKLCDEYSADCEADPVTITPQPGDTFSLLNPEDGGWYRARLLTKKTAALLDSPKTIEITTCKKLSDKYVNIPEFGCVIAADVNIGDTLKCTILSKSPKGFQVSVEHMETGVSVGEGIVSRWLPEVEYPKPVITATSTEIPEIPRPPVTNNSKVILVEATSLDRALVLDVNSLNQYESVLQMGVAIDNPLKQPPNKGQVVIGKFSDGLGYRAMCKRTSVKMNKYLIEYIEFGNEEKTTLEHLHECPPELNLANAPSVTSVVRLGENAAMTPPATEYVEMLKDKMEPLLLTLPPEVKTAPSGSEATLTVVKNKENVNKKLQKLCDPEWKLINDVLDTRPIMYRELEYSTFPLTSCELDVVYIDMLEEGSLCACLKGDKKLEYVVNTLTPRMLEYCNSDIGKEPYLPMPEELCLALWPLDDTWYRAVLLEQVNGPGGNEARVFFIDYGNVELVPTRNLRKMLPEFVKQPPAVNHFDIEDFPQNPTPEMLQKALLYMKVDEDGRGILKVDKLTKQQDSEDGAYIAVATGLIKCMK